MDNKTKESMNWYFEQLSRKVIDQLHKNNIQGFYVKTAEEALTKLLSMIPPGARVASGGSLTLQQLGIIDALRSGPYNYIDRNKAGLNHEEEAQLRKAGLMADIFLMSSNALTEDGKIVNIDGTGNRVAALIYGPAKVIIVVGINKIVPDAEAALYRIKNYVTPIHSRRRNKPLPCAKTGFCTDCKAPERSCCSVVIIEYQRSADRITVLIVGEELGL